SPLGASLFLHRGPGGRGGWTPFALVLPFGGGREPWGGGGRVGWGGGSPPRLTADRDPQPAIFGLVLRSLRALEGGARPQRVASCFGLRAVDLLGHRPRIDRCIDCGRLYPFPGAGLDVLAGGRLCAGCGRGARARRPSAAAAGGPP